MVDKDSRLFTFVAERQLGRGSRESPKESSLTKPKEDGNKRLQESSQQKVTESECHA